MQNLIPPQAVGAPGSPIRINQSQRIIQTVRIRAPARGLAVQRVDRRKPPDARIIIPRPVVVPAQAQLLVQGLARVPIRLPQPHRRPVRSAKGLVLVLVPNRPARIDHHRRRSQNAVQVKTFGMSKPMGFRSCILRYCFCLQMGHRGGRCDAASLVPIQSFSMIKDKYSTISFLNLNIRDPSSHRYGTRVGV